MSCFRQNIFLIMISAMICLGVNVDIQGACTAAWPMIEVSGTSVTDYATGGSALDTCTFGIASVPASIFNPTWSSDTPFAEGRSLYFDGNINSGSGDYLFAADSEDLSVGTNGQMTLMAWIKLVDTRTHYIINKWSTNSVSRSYLFSIEPQAGGVMVPKLSLSSDGSTSTYLTGPLSKPIPKNEWHHVAAVLTSVPGGRAEILYIDGIEVARSSTPLSGSFAVFNGSNQLWIGRFGNSVSNACISDIRIFDEGLDSNQIVSYAADPESHRYMTAKWLFNEGTGVICNDSSQTGNVIDTASFGYASNPSSPFNPAWSSDTAFTTEGYSLQFDGNFSYPYCDYVFAGDSPDISVGSSGELSVEVWFKPESGASFYAVNKWNTDLLDRSYLLCAESVGGQLRAKFSLSKDGSTSTDLLSTSTYAVIPNQWVHLVGVLSMTGLGKRMILYKDGEEIARAAVPANFAVHDSSNQLWAGRYANTACAGKIDEIRIYNYALNSQEISANYSRKAQKSPTLKADFNNDFNVDFYDMQEFVLNWLTSTAGSNTDINKDGITDLRDFAYVASEFLKSTRLCAMAQSHQIPDGAPSLSDVCFSSRWIRPKDGSDPYNTFTAAASFFATRLDWLYLTWNVTADTQFISTAHSKDYPVCAAINPSMPDQVGGSTRNVGRMEDLNGNKITPPYYSSGYYIGCCNQQAYRDICMAHIKYIIDVGADQIQHDDPAMNSSAVSWGGCYCQDCISKFRGYLSQKYTATELLALGITDMNGFSYKQYKLSGGNNSQLANDFDLFQKVSAVEYFNYIFQQTNAYAGKSVPFSSNNVGGVWSSPYDCFSFGIAELSESQLSVPELWLKYNAAVSFGKAQIFTLQSIDKEIYRRAIASSFGCGGHILAPWDVSISNPPPDRFFGIPSDYNDLYKFVRDHQQFFDGYEDAATFGPHMSDIRYDSNDAPMWISSGGKDVYLFARAKPNDVNAAVIIHVIDWSYLPTSFEIDLKKVRFYGATNNLSITLLRPNQNDLALSVSTSNGIASVVVPSVSPWGILVVGKY